MKSEISYQIRRIVLLDSEYDMILVETNKVDQVRFRVYSEDLIRCYGSSEKKFSQKSNSIASDLTDDLVSILEINRENSRQIAVSVVKKLD